MNAPYPNRQFDAAAASLRLFAVFHLNLAFSAIEEDQRAEVIAKCYWPLLRLAEKCGPIGIEASGYTLEEIAARDPYWIEKLKELMGSGQAEFIGAGYAQIVAPLVPWRVTEANLAIGNEIYEKLLGRRPVVALVNEQAYSGGLVGLYLDAGYQALLMDWDNPASHQQWAAETGFRAQRALGADGRSIGLLWTNTVAFQKLQRFAHGDIEIEDYLAYVRAQQGSSQRLLCLYASDAEIFDFRPGRYRTEESLKGGSEWSKLEDAFARVALEDGCALLAPSQLVPEPNAKTEPLRLETADCPVPVKKQRKYNLSRWAVTGRDDLAINAACESIYRGMMTGSAGPSAWRELCYLWSSDFRTHITDKRWTEMCRRLRAAQVRWSPPEPPPPPMPRGSALTARHFEIVTPSVKARVDRRRGLALSQVHFFGHDRPAAGTLPHGHFADIALQADWYTGNCVFEAPGEHKVTDLEWCNAHLWKEGDDLMTFGRIDTPKGAIEKTVRFHARKPQIDFDILFRWEEWGRGSLRLGHITLLPDGFDWEKLSVAAHNGGKDAETFALSGTAVDHGAPVSFLVSASHGLAMTEGWLEIGDDTNRLRVAVDRTMAPLLGLLTYRQVRGGHFCQLALSALELDDTRKPQSLRPGPRRFRFSVAAATAEADC
ncbi:MAG: glycoside hydrolase family 57 [Alphaproteobacteria bacterium]|nr:glycoside hydrolase family 57 [Alphaproteobacteria bacterium]